MKNPFSDSQDSTVLVGATIYASPAEEAHQDGIVLMRAGKIIAVGGRGAVQIPASATVIDCSGSVITAGFWNSHVHFFERKWADAGAIPAVELGRQLEHMLTRYGFTSVFDTGSMWSNTKRIHERVESGEVAGPRIRSTGEALIARGALPSDTVIRMMGGMMFPAPEITETAQAVDAARKLLAEGVDAIKVHLQPPPPPNAPFPESAMRAAVDEAHRAAKPVFVHPNSAADILAAVRSGVDIIAHTTPRSGPWGEPMLIAMQERRVALTPTLWIWKYYARHDRISTQEQIVNTSAGQLRAWVECGGTVLFGIDLGAVDPDPSEEYALMAESGMTFRQILASLTTAPAERFGEAGRLGRVAAGLEADLVVLNRDPAADIRALTTVRYTLRSGKILYRAANSR